jgi:hypothetical protein
MLHLENMEMHWYIIYPILYNQKIIYQSHMYWLLEL